MSTTNQLPEIIERRRAAALAQVQALESERKALKGQVNDNGARLNVAYTRLQLLKEIEVELKQPEPQNERAAVAVSDVAPQHVLREANVACVVAGAVARTSLEHTVSSALATAAKGIGQTSFFDQVHGSVARVIAQMHGNPVTQAQASARLVQSALGVMH